jgi:hypothetical protein
MKETVNLLWTGGWDSTFRLLQLIVIEKKHVQPHYIIDSNRKSTRKEISTIRNIKRQLFKDFPYAKELLLRTIFIERDDIAADKLITKQLNNLKKQVFIGNQYDWLARYSKQFNISNLELSIHQDGKTQTILQPLTNKKEDGIYYLKPEHYNSSKTGLFRYFRFPIFEISKLQMAELAHKHKFFTIINMTWFCHEPNSKEESCGHCNPCTYAMEEGLKDRIPFLNRTIKRFYIKKIKSKYKKNIKTLKRLFTKIKNESSHSQSLQRSPQENKQRA